MSRGIFHEQSGAAAAEMALVAPLLMLIMFGSMELGHYFYSEHVVVKAARDGARFASRQPFSKFTCSTVDSTVETNTKNLTRTETIDGSGTPRLGGWIQNSTVNVSVRCDNTGTYSAIYEGMTGGIPVVKVTATVPYSSLFKVIGFNSATLNVQAASEAPVMGI